MNLAEYADHLTTDRHKLNFDALLRGSEKPLGLIKILSTAEFQIVLNRNKELRNEQ